jgi:MoaA/NifB/PqqE/SkfB family radical SAM enzyme
MKPLNSSAQARTAVEDAQAPSGQASNSKPVARPQTGVFRMIGDVLDHGGPGYLQFAITNLCNATCDFCNFAVDKFDHNLRRSVTLQQAKDVIDIAVKNHIGYMMFLGGEPLVHKDLRAMVRYCAESGIHAMICTNGSLWTDRNMREYAHDGLTSVIMSIDAHDVAQHEKNRGLPDVCRKIRHANELFAELGVQTTASVTASRLIEDYEKLPDFLAALGFRSCTFSYPLTSLASSYLGFADSKLVNFDTQELIGVFEKIKRLKEQQHKNGGLPVINPRAGLEEMQRHLRREKEQFGCLGGYKYFYVDWNLDLYRCGDWATPMCSIYEFDDSKLIRDGCTRCMMDCYRDSSIMHYVAVSASDAYHNLREGKLIAAAKNVFDRRNLTSIRAIWDDRKWIGEALVKD